MERTFALDMDGMDQRLATTCCDTNRFTMHPCSKPKDDTFPYKQDHNFEIVVVEKGSQRPIPLS